MADTLKMGDLRFFVTVELEGPNGILSELRIERSDLKQAGSWTAKKLGKGKNETTKPAEYWERAAQHNLGEAILSVAEGMLDRAAVKGRRKRRRRYT
ncbi:MAG: hypothetical protein AAGA99_00485 [Actinomycetota bacterium]